MELCHEFPALSPWNVYDLEIRHYLGFTAYIDHLRDQQKAEARTHGG